MARRRPGSRGKGGAVEQVALEQEKAAEKEEHAQAAVDEEGISTEATSSPGDDDEVAEPPLPCVPARLPTFSVDETLLILDWDDTCLPSSWINAHGLRLDSAVPDECVAALDQLAPRVTAFLQFCKARARVLFITNAESGWVERSCLKFLPACVAALEGIRIFSARSSFEQEGVFAPLDWKRKAFQSIITDEMATSVVRSVLSLGDSPHERDALFTARDALAAHPDGAAFLWRSKSVKFMERPDCAQLMREHLLVLQFFDQVLDHDGDLDLCIKCC